MLRIIEVIEEDLYGDINPIQNAIARSFNISPGKVRINSFTQVIIDGQICSFNRNVAKWLQRYDYFSMNGGNIIEALYPIRFGISV